MQVETRRTFAPESGLGCRHAAQLLYARSPTSACRHRCDSPRTSPSLAHAPENCVTTNGCSTASCSVDSVTWPCTSYGIRKARHPGHRTGYTCLATQHSHVYMLEKKLIMGEAIRNTLSFAKLRRKNSNILRTEIRLSIAVSCPIGNITACEKKAYSCSAKSAERACGNQSVLSNGQHPSLTACRGAPNTPWCRADPHPPLALGGMS